MGPNKHCCYLRRGGLQHPGQGGENGDEQQGLSTVKIFLFAAKQVQQGPLQTDGVDILYQRRDQSWTASWLEQKPRG